MNNIMETDRRFSRGLGDSGNNTKQDWRSKPILQWARQDVADAIRDGYYTMSPDEQKAVLAAGCMRQRNGVSAYDEDE